MLHKDSEIQNEADTAKGSASSISTVLLIYWLTNCKRPSGSLAI